MVGLGAAFGEQGGVQLLGGDGGAASGHDRSSSLVQLSGREGECVLERDGFGVGVGRRHCP